MTARTAMTKYHVLGVNEQWKFISHSSAGWKSKIKAPEWPCSLEGTLFLVFSWCLLIVPSDGRRGRDLSGTSFTRTKPSKDDSTLMT